jgi:alanyl-tRNA synthetase
MPAQATIEDSIEFCGGTHLHHTGEAGLFKVISQDGVAKGVRRLTAVSGRGALAVVQQQATLLESLCGRFNCKPEELGGRVEALQDEVRKLQTALKKGTATDLAGAADRLLAEASTFGESHVIVGELPAAPLDQMRAQLDRLRTKAKSAVIVVGWIEEGKVGLLAAVTEDLTKRGLEAGKLIGEVAKIVGGKGGGRKEMAQAGGTDPAKLSEALTLAKKLAGEKLGNSES